MNLKSCVNTSSNYKLQVTGIKGLHCRPRQSVVKPVDIPGVSDFFQLLFGWFLFAFAVMLIIAPAVQSAK